MRMGGNSQGSAMAEMSRKPEKRRAETAAGSRGQGLSTNGIDTYSGSSLEHIHDKSVMPGGLKSCVGAQRSDVLPLAD
jgi:hypothetical protein